MIKYGFLLIDNGKLRLTDKGLSYLHDNDIYVWIHQNTSILSLSGYHKGDTDKFIKQFKASKCTTYLELIEKLAKNSFPTTIPFSEFDSIQEALSYKNSYNCTIQDLKECLIYNCNYLFLATLDKTTCEVCGKLDHKTFNPKNAFIGVNCPPMHKGCRCSIYAEIEGLNHSKRGFRDPTTNKWVVGDWMDYKTYKKKYLDKK